MQELEFFRARRRFDNGERRSDALFDLPLGRIDSEALRAYLHLGYVPGQHTLFEGVKCKLSSNYSASDMLNRALRGGSEYSPREVKDLLLSYIEKAINFSDVQIVPLSGGIDSRIVLGLLSNFVEAKKIQTYTFGVPGTYDFDIPNSVAKYVGTSHRNFAATDTVYNIDGLIRAAKATDANTEIFHPLVLNRVVDYYGECATYWSGFAGDLVGGGFAFKENMAAVSQLVAYENRGIYFLDKTKAIDECAPLITLGSKMGGAISFAEACFWENHVERYTAHHIFRNDMKVYAPLVSIPFVSYFFSLGNKHRKDKKYFNELFSNLFSDLFEIPTKDYGFIYSRRRYLQIFNRMGFYSRAALWRIMPSFIPHPRASYIDMAYAINRRADVRCCIDELLSDLCHRNIVDSRRVKYMLSAHRTGKSNYTKDIINLASLEIFIKAAL
jgi:hypothetical protein